MTEDLKTLAQALERMGCPPAKTAEMAAQLDRRAAQLAAQTGRSHAEALAHLLALMQQGWAAQSHGSPPAKP
jgi:hypothetical protein